VNLARTEQDKEDLIRDGTAMVERAELTSPMSDQLLTIGFFRDGRCSVYFNQDPFYQFDSSGRLRRAFEAGFLYRSQGITLARIDRRRESENNSDAGRVTLQRKDLQPDELQQFAVQMKSRLVRLRDHIVAGQIKVKRSVTETGGLPTETVPLLNRVLKLGDEFLAPTVGAR